VGAVVILALVGVGAYFALRPTGNPSAHINPTATNAVATATNAPTATATRNATVTYTENIPSCASPNNWSVNSSQVSCGSSSVTITDPASSHTLSEADFNGTGSSGFAFGSSYDVSVNMSNLVNACAGIIVLRNKSNNAGVGVLLCSDGSWDAIQYSPAGSPKILGSGNAGAVTIDPNQNILDLLVTPSSIQVTEAATSLTNIPRSDSLTTDFISLAVENSNSASAGACNFDTFAFSGLS